MRAKITRRRVRRSPPKSNERRRSPTERHVVEELKLIALTLEAVLATTITAQTALESMSVDVDSDIACCLRRNVSDQITGLMEKLGSLIKLHGGALPERLQ